MDLGCSLFLEQHRHIPQTHLDNSTQTWICQYGTAQHYYQDPGLCHDDSVILSTALKLEQSLWLLLQYALDEM
jgi:hypothetical protein